jgi:putative CocE/NonD family hydrolase
MDDDVRIPLADGTVLLARIWRPVDSDGAPVPAVLEYLPYRRRDGTAERDHLTHPYVAGHGYACVRVDMRGTGDSDGIILGEYLKQEQDDALEVIAWIAAQPWCSGAVGMIGISWGGFNGLQVAARRPPALKAIVTIASTDDRYADDIHFMGGALLNDKLGWGSTIFSINAAPPDPAIVGERWREMWLERLDRSGLWYLDWLRHQRRDDFYKQGSVCEDWDAIQCAVYAVGGWADGYSNAIFRLLANLKGPKKGLCGSWGHRYPHFGRPGDEIGFLQECIRWWDRWLKGIDNGIMEEPELRAWLEDPVPPASDRAVRPGRWVAEAAWPSPRIGERLFSLTPGLLAEAVAPGRGPVMTIRSPQTVGLAAGHWCPYGNGHDQSGDQRIEAGGSLLFDSAPLAEGFEMLGAPELDLWVAADKPNALVAATLSEILPDGAVLRISYGVLNLTHRESHETPSPLEPGKLYNVKIRMNEAGHRFAKGARIRLAISSAYWPVLFPSPEATTLSITALISRLSLPDRPASPADDTLAPFPPSEASPALAKTVLVPPDTRRTITTDIETGIVTYELDDDSGTWRLDDIDLSIAIHRRRRFSIHPDDPSSAKVEMYWFRAYARGDWRVAAESDIVMTGDKETFHVVARLDGWEGEARVFSRNWAERIARDLV